MAKWGFPLTKDELKNVVCDYVTANGLKTVFKNNKPGNDWFASFCNRRRLSLKKPENLETVRRNATKDPFIIYDFYDLLETEIEKLGLQDKPNHIFNLDETCFTFDPSRTKAVGAKGEKFHRNIQGSGKENITVLGNVSADGQLLPPLFVFQASNLWSSWKGNNDLPNTFYACSEKGWMTSQIFQEYFYKFCAFVKQRPILLIFDGHLSHLDVGTIEKAKAENITIIKLPAHTTDLLQPLDTCCFRPLKNLWDRELVSWQRENQRKLSKSEFVDLLCKIWHEGITPQTILTGFRSTGIYPPNRNKYPVSRQNPEPDADVASSSTLDPQTNTLQNINSVIQQNQLQATISFESLLLDKVNKHPKPVPPTRRRIDGKGKLQSYFLIIDDVMDKSELRRGQPCWYKQEGVGIAAINDALLVESSIYTLLRKYFSEKECYRFITELFHEITTKTIMGQSLDMMSNNPDGTPRLDLFTMNRSSAIVKYKTAYYTFQLPDDFFDCYGDPEVTGKKGTDIKEGKCSWLAVVALQRATPAQRKIMEEHYGKDDEKSIQMVKDLYQELNLPHIYATYEEESYNRIRTHIQQISKGLPHELFFKLLKKVYKRDA
nr:unnamed protein product [Callosobruchus chinensis]